MRLDVVELQNFYFQTELGIKITKIINKALDPFLEDQSTKFLIGFGFTCPFLDITTIKNKFKKRSVISLMPGEQGVISWPKDGKNLSVLVDETSWPIKTSSADLIIVAHGLEVSASQTDLLQEASRVLDTNGKLILIVPNRTGFWSRSDNTPFGYGKPYTIKQLSYLLSKNQFQIESIKSALYGLPAQSGYRLRSINFWETVGNKFNNSFFGGLLIVEAHKSFYGAQAIKPNWGKKFSRYGEITITP
jgi:SAM-dependent methyltransferase